MNNLSARSLAKLAIALTLPGAVMAQAPQQAEEFVIAGQSGQAPLYQSNGKSYIDIESLARITHGSLQFQDNRVILTLPSSAGTTTQAQQNKPPQLSQAFLTAEIEALTQIREWRAWLASAIQNNYPITEGRVGPIQRSAESKEQLAIAAASTAQDHQAVGLLRNEYANMLQLSNQFLTLQSSSSYIATDAMNSNPLNQKILSCERALVSMAASKQFQDEQSCH